MANFRQLCTESAGGLHVLQGNIAFATGIVRSGIHAVDGYPGTPSTEVIDKGLSAVQDLLSVGWSVNEAVAVGVGVGHTYAGFDAVVTMKIPGVFQAADVISSVASYTSSRGGLVLYVASDFTPSSTQHVIDPRYFYKSCFIPVFEPRNHQELHESATLMADLARKFNTISIIQTAGLLCHSEGLVKLSEIKVRKVAKVDKLSQFISLPAKSRVDYNKMMSTRMPELLKFVEETPLNVHIKGKGLKGIITCGAGVMYALEYKKNIEPDIDILSLAFTNPLPIRRIKNFADKIKKNGGKVFVLEDGYRFIQESCLATGIDVIGKDQFSPLTEWSHSSVADFLGEGSVRSSVPSHNSAIPPVPRPPMICAGCPYRLIGLHLAKLHKRGDIEAIFGDIGCNTLLHFMGSLDTALAMGASEAIRTGYALSNPEASTKCVSILGDGTECHTGIAATRNAVFRDVPGVKIILDNNWIAMTGGQPSPASPANLAGVPSKFDLPKAIEAQGAEVLVADAYVLDDIRRQLEKAFALANEHKFVVLIIRGTCIRKVSKSKYNQKITVNADICKKCGACIICPGIEKSDSGLPSWNNLCTGCVSNLPACLQMCHFGAISIAHDDFASKVTKRDSSAKKIDEFEIPTISPSSRPKKLSVAIRGVGGQGNLFFGRVLARMALIAGYGDSCIMKGETHGMAQMGGPVISTFACGEVYCPDLAEHSVDCIISMEESEILRPGFLDLLKPDGIILLSDAKIYSQASNRDDYPKIEDILDVIGNRTFHRLNVLDIAIKLGDPTGRCSNSVMLGVLSRLQPFNEIPKEIWISALREETRSIELFDLNYAAFLAGVKML